MFLTNVKDPHGVPTGQGTIHSDRGLPGTGQGDPRLANISASECIRYAHMDAIEREDARIESEAIEKSDPIPSALNKQVAGDHYKKMKIQPVEFIHANNIPFIEGCIIKYAARWRDKGGIKDLEKIKHFADLLIELESRNG